MRSKKMFLAVALVSSVLMLAPSAADAQRRGGGGRVAVRHAPVRTHISFGAYFGSPYYFDSFWWGYPRFWYPFGYGPYWYGPYWNGGYYGGGYYGGAYGASIKFDVKPKKAEVYVDERYAGPVEDYGGFFQSLDVSPGSHSITLWLQGYQTVTQNVYVQRGGTLKMKYNLVPLAAGEHQDPRPVPPPEPQQQQQPPERYRRPGPPPEPYQVEPPARPARPQPRQNPDQPGEEASVRDYGQLALRVQPAGAQILIDGQAWQTSPDADRLVVHLSAGMHQVEIRKDGFRPFKTEVQVRNGVTTPLNVSLSGQDDR